VVGLGAGTLASFTREGTRMRYFEIDPEVERIARDPNYFTYLSQCAKGKVDVVLGDARLTLAREPVHSYDLLQVDAFSADNVPTHLLTTEALTIYFHALKPDGILALHLSNRNLALEPPAAAAAKAIGVTALMQEFTPPRGTPAIAAAPSQVMLLSKSPAALAAFAGDPRWRPARDNGVRAWTDGYTNIVGALIDHAKQ
jgi:spermidine synthase